jgi:beta-lactam-binding protein with PASTA domain
VADQDQETQDRDSRTSAWAWVAIIAIVLIVLLLLLSYCRSTAPEVTTTGTPTATVTIPEATATPIPTSTPVSALTTPSPPTIPNVVNYVESRAQSNLEQAGYGVSVSHVYSAFTKGRVLDQNPPGGTVAPPGTGVSITVSDGRAPQGTVRVPDVLGMSVSAAKSRIRAAGLTPNAIPRPRPDSVGRIWDQYPLAGNRAPEGSEVTLLYGME